MTLHIAMEDPAQPEIIGLLRDAEALSAQLYPAESNHHLPVDALRAANIRFYVGRDTSGGALATGALVVNGFWGEVKAMWVAPDARGQGISRLILAAIEAQARREGVRDLYLETGVVSHAALGLDARAGFEKRGPFADYPDDPLSVFMQTELIGARA